MVPTSCSRSQRTQPHRRLNALGRDPMTSRTELGEPPSTLRREIRIPIYWLVVGLMVMVVSPLLSIYTSVKISQRTIVQTQTEQAKAASQARVEGLAVYCRLVGTQVDVYSEAITSTGKRAYDTWLTEYRRSGCKPGK